ncbi:MAG: hypothetical protein LW832_08705 [Parachlamydia sp.]|jgi:hypothetical protein|nr:hypothetical protein [Parachlamydia sp.]
MDFSRIGSDCKQGVIGAYGVFTNVCGAIADGRNVVWIFQKSFQAGVHFIKLANHIQGTNYLPKFSKTALSAVGMHDFHLIFREGRGWFKPINCNNIDAQAVLVSLKEKLREQLLTKGYLGDQVDEFARLMLENQLSSMRDNDDVYSSTEVFLQALQNRMTEMYDIVLEQMPPIDVLADGTYLNISFADRQNLDLSRVEVALIPAKSLSQLIHANWLAVNILCVGSYFQNWNVLDTARHANSIGRFKVTSWVKDYTLEAWLRGAVTVGFALTLVKASIDLGKNWSNEVERRRAAREVAASLFEVIYQGAGFLNYTQVTSFGPAFIYLAAIAAKSCGICCIIADSRDKRRFLTAPAA